jgi:dTDP-4-dehydrorhamnose reductase
MLRLAVQKPGQTIKVVNDQYGCPTWSMTLARQILRVVETGATGIFHATGEGYCTWYELACFFLEAMEVDHGVVPCATEEYPTPALRPKNSILENARLKEQGICVMRDWREDVREFVARYRDMLMEEARGGEGDR